MELLTILTKLTKLPERDVLPVLDFFETADVSAQKLLLSPGMVCSQIWFVGTGSIRAYYQVEERKRGKKGEIEEKTTREVTNWLIPAGGVHTAMRSFSPQTPTSYFVETLEQCHLYTLSYQNYRSLLRSHAEVVVKIFEQVFIMTELRLEICNLRFPKDRLRMFDRTYPGKTSHLSVNVQATYLNIDPSTLSRWRKKGW